MAGDGHPRGLLDTNVVILRRRIDATELPDEMAISAVTLAELSAGPHQVRVDETRYEASAERARRLDVLQRAEHEFDAIPFDADAARAYGRVVAAVVAAGRQPRRRIADLMIAAVARANDLPLFTTNPDDFVGLADLIAVVPVAVPTR
jgi:predicted nucleic acid-binding protein